MVVPILVRFTVADWSEADAAPAGLRASRSTARRAAEARIVELEARFGEKRC